MSGSVSMNVTVCVCFLLTVSHCLSDSRALTKTHGSHGDALNPPPPSSFPLLSPSLPVSLWFLSLCGHHCIPGSPGTVTWVALWLGWDGGGGIGAQGGGRGGEDSDKTQKQNQSEKAQMTKKKKKNVCMEKIKWNSSSLWENRSLGCETGNHLSSIVSRKACIGCDGRNRKCPPVALFSASVLLLLLLWNCRLLWTGPVLWCAAVTARPCHNLQGAW